MQKIGQSVIENKYLYNTACYKNETKIHSFNISILQETKQKTECADKKINYT